MPNFLYEEPIKALSARLVAQHLGGVVPQPALERVMRLVVGELRGDARNAMPARQDEISERAPPWAKAAAERGVELHWFAPAPLAVARIKRTLKNLRAAHGDTRAAEQTDQALSGYALRMFQNLDHMTFADLENKAKAQSRMRARVERRRAEAAMKTLGFCEPETIPVGRGKRWRRLVSVAELGEAGKMMRNCTAFDRPQNRHYGKMLMEGEAEFWLLETRDGEPLVQLMASAAQRMVLEYQGPGNRPIDPASPDLAVLMQAKGLCFKRPFHRTGCSAQLMLGLREVQRQLNVELNGPR